MRKPTVDYPNPVAPKAVTFSAIAKAAGISAGAVSSFFSGRYYANDPKHGIGLSEESRQRILRASRELCYQPPDPAWRVRIYPETGDFCFLLDQAVPDGIANQYFGRMLKGAVARIDDPEHPVVFAQFDRTDYLVMPERLPAPLRKGTGSKLLVAGNPNYSLLMAIARRGFFAVHLSRAVSVPGICSIVPDYVTGARMAVEALVKAGHKRIAIAAEHYFTPGAYHVEQRLRGLAEAFAAAGIVFKPENVIYKSPTDNGENSIFETIKRQEPRPTAIFCFDDWTALGVMDAAEKAGWRLPKDLSIVGCNDDARSALVHPALTTVHFPAEEMAAAAVDKLNEMSLRGPSSETIVLPVKFIERESIAPPKGGEG